MSAAENARRRRALERLFRKQKGRCHYCLTECVLPPKGQIGKPQPDNQFTRDHVLARSLGGANSPENVVGSCRACNNAKGRMEHRNAERKRAA